MSRGTLDSIAKARHAGRELVVFPCVPVPICSLREGCGTDGGEGKNAG